MGSLRLANWALPLLLLAAICGLTACGVNTRGRMDWVQPRTTTPRVGTVYLIRGWSGIFSSGIDAMAEEIRKEGVTAHVYQPEQYQELATAIMERYKNDPQREPICFIGHSRGCDSALIIAREIDRVDLNVDLVVTLDSVDEVRVPPNVLLCYNYWMHGFFPGTNLLRGIPLVQDPGSRGKLHNVNLDTDAPELKDFYTTHVVIDKGAKLQRRIVEHVLQVCPERSKWLAKTSQAPNSRR